MSLLGLRLPDSEFPQGKRLVRERPEPLAVPARINQVWSNVCRHREPMARSRIFAPLKTGMMIEIRGPADLSPASIPGLMRRTCRPARWGP
jgi:hypothetical protein